jgi:diguanylate cyclase (GGDEF)-like protein
MAHRSRAPNLPNIYNSAGICPGGLIALRERYVKGRIALNLFSFLDTSLYWLAVIAAVGLAAMATLVLLVVAMKWSVTSEWVRRTVLRAPTLRGRMLIGLFLIGAIPVMTLPPILTLENARTRQLEMVDELAADANNVAHGVGRMVNKQVAGIEMLAGHINSLERFDNSNLGGWLLRHHTANPEFVSSWIAQPDGKVVAATAFLDGDHQPWEGPLNGVSLMDFFLASVENGGLYISPVMKGVAPRHDPMIVISAPLIAGGSRPWGFVQGQLNLRRLYRNVVSYDLIPGRPVFITDARNRVMAASPQVAFKTFEDLSGHPVVTRMVEDTSTTYGFKGALEIDEPSKRYLAVQRELDNGWRVFAVSSLSGTQSQALVFFALSLLWVLIVAFLAVNLAGLYGGIVGQPLQTLNNSLDIFDAEQTLKMVPMAPLDAPSEIAHIFNRVRRSMEKSRDSYRNMLRAVNEGDELRRKLQAHGHARPRPPPSAKAAKKRKSAPTAAKKKTGAPVTKAAVAEYAGRWDSLTGLAGREVFKEFFGEAWVLGCADRRPVSMLSFSIGFGKIRAVVEGGTVDDEVLKSAGEVLRGVVGRELDLVARLDGDKYVIVLPDTDFFGAVVVAERARQALQAVLPEVSGGKALAANVGVASIVPTPTGDASAFVKSVQRVLMAAEKTDGSRVAYADEKQQIKVLEIGEPLPIARRAPPAAKSDPASAPGDKTESGSSGLSLSLEDTGQARPDKRVANSDVVADDEDTVYASASVESDANDTHVIDWEP